MKLQQLPACWPEWAKRKIHVGFKWHYIQPFRVVFSDSSFENMYSCFKLFNDDLWHRTQLTLSCETSELCHYFFVYEWKINSCNMLTWTRLCTIICITIDSLSLSFSVWFIVTFFRLMYLSLQCNSSWGHTSDTNEKHGLTYGRRELDIL